MPKVVDIPGLGAVEFPDDLEGDALDKAVQRVHQQGVNEKLKTANATPLEAEKVQRGGLFSPLTSLIAPEVAKAREALAGATAERPGDTQPVMARSRTGTLYPSGINTGGIGAIGRGVAAGAGETALNQIEGATTPAGLALAAAGPLVRGAQQIPAGVQRALDLAKTKGAPALRVAKAAATDADVVGLVSPRAAHAMKVAEKGKAIIDKARAAVAAEDAAAAEAGAAETSTIPDPRERPVSSMPDRRTVDQGAPGGVSERRLAELRDKFTNEQKLSDPRYEDAVKSAAAPPPVTSINDAMKAAIARAKDAQAPVGVTRGKAATALQQVAKAPPPELSGRPVMLTAAETRSGMDLVAKGATPEQALQAILEHRQLQGSSVFARLPSDAQVKSAVAARNASGRWAGQEP